MGVFWWFYYQNTPIFSPNSGNSQGARNIANSILPDVFIGFYDFRSDQACIIMEMVVIANRLMGFVNQGLLESLDDEEPFFSPPIAHFAYRF